MKVAKSLMQKRFKVEDFEMFIHWTNKNFDVMRKSDKKIMFETMQKEVDTLVNKHNKIVEQMPRMSKRDFKKARIEIDEIFGLVQTKLELINAAIKESRKLKEKAA